MNGILFLIRTAFEDLKKNKGRTFLTSLGILIGVLSVVLLISFGVGLRNYIENQFQSLGTNIIIVLPGSVISNGNFRSGARALTANFDDTDTIKLQRIDNTDYVVPVFTKSISVTSAKDSKIADLYATTSDIFPLRNLEPMIGTLFTKSDVEKRSKKAVLGPKIARDIFVTEEAALGKTVRLEDQTFTVIGVLKEKGGGGFGGPDFDSFVYIPSKSAVSFNPDKKFFAFYVKAITEDAIPQVKEDIKRTLLKRYKEDEFSVVEQTEILNIVTSIFGVLNTVLVAIGSISLLVGGIGIMNIMYATVTERIREIGIRRALGATRKDILLQFLTEAVILSLFGALLGLLLSALVVFLIQPYFPASLNLFSILIAIGVSSGIGIFFGVFPARRAANLSPIDAIRYE